MNDDSPPLITGNSSIVKNIVSASRSINVINKLWTVVMEKVTLALEWGDVIDYVMSENIDSDGCDGCDGKNEKSPGLESSVESKVNCNTNDREDLEKKEISQEFLKMPSQASHEQGKSHIDRSVTDSSEPSQVVKSAIKVGDKVVVENSPSYWSWASPFTVQSIEGEMVKLEMVNELLKISRLSLSKLNNKN